MDECRMGHYCIYGTPRLPCSKCWYKEVEELARALTASCERYGLGIFFAAADKVLGQIHRQVQHHWRGLEHKEDWGLIEKFLGDAELAAIVHYRNPNALLRNGKTVGVVFHTILTLNLEDVLKLFQPFREKDFYCQLNSGHVTKAPRLMLAIEVFRDPKERWYRPSED